MDAWESHGPTAEEELKEARQLLEQLNNKAHDGSSSSNGFSIRASALPQVSGSSHSEQSKLPLARGPLS